MQALHGQAVRACWAATCGRRAPAGGVQTQPVCRRSRSENTRSSADVHRRHAGGRARAGTQVWRARSIRSCSSWEVDLDVAGSSVGRSSEGVVDAPHLTERRLRRTAGAAIEHMYAHMCRCLSALSALSCGCRAGGRKSTDGGGRERESYVHVCLWLRVIRVWRVCPCVECAVWL